MSLRFFQKTVHMLLLYAPLSLGEKSAAIDRYYHSRYRYFGRTQSDAPDIDGKIFFTSDRKLEIGQYVKVKITDSLDYDLIGEVI